MNKILRYIGCILFRPIWCLGRLVPRSKKICFFEAWYGQKYSDNSKWLYEIGVAAPMIIDVIEAELFGKEKMHQKIKEKSKVKPPKEYRYSVYKRKWVLKKYTIKKQLIDKRKVLTKLFNMYYSYVPLSKA